MRLQRHCASFSVRPGRPCAILAHRPKPACSSASSRRCTVSDAVHLSLDVRLPLGPQPAASAGDVSSPSMPSSPPSPHPAPWWSGVGMRLTRRRAALSSSITGTSLPAIDTVTPDRGMMRSAWFRSFLLAVANLDIGFCDFAASRTYARLCSVSCSRQASGRTCLKVASSMDTFIGSV